MSTTDIPKGRSDPTGRFNGCDAPRCETCDESRRVRANGGRFVWTICTNNGEVRSPGGWVL